MSGPNGPQLWIQRALEVIAWPTVRLNRWLYDHDDLRQLVLPTLIVSGVFGISWDVWAADVHPTGYQAGGTVLLALTVGMVLRDWAEPDHECPPPEVRIEQRLVPTALRLADDWDPTELDEPGAEPVLIAATMQMARFAMTNAKVPLGTAEALVFVPGQLSMLQALARGRHVWLVGPWWDAMPPDQYRLLVQLLVAREFTCTWLVTP